MIRRLFVVASAALGLLVFAASAGAAQLGITAQPSGSTNGGCFALIVQATDTSTTPYTIPIGGGKITQWQTYTVGDTAGSTMTLAVLRPTSSTTWAVVGVNTQTLPNPLPSNGIASFALSTPLQVQAGDVLALDSTTAGNTCWYTGGSTLAGDSLFSLTGTPASPVIGEDYTISSSSGANFTLDLGATLSQTVDAGVQTSAFPSTADVASGALLSSMVTNGGPNSAPITFVDQVPTGLQVQSASVGTGTCAVSGQTVTCTISGLLVGQSTTANVVVMAAQAGTYANDITVSVPSGVTDPNSANNVASANLVAAALPKECIVPGSLHKMTLASARTLLNELGCTVGTVSQHSGIKKGLVLSVRGGARAYPYQQKVIVVVSSGPKKKKKK